MTFQGFGNDTEQQQIGCYLIEAFLVDKDYQVATAGLTPLLLILLGTFRVPFNLYLYIGSFSTTSSHC